MKAFCFHSVRGELAVPPEISWGSSERYRQMVEHQRVGPDWFMEWVKRAQERWANHDLTITFDDGYADVLLPAIYAKRKYGNTRVIVFVSTAHLGQLFPGTPYRVLNSAEILYLHKMGVEIGSHGHRHERMDHLAETVAEARLLNSYDVIDSITGSAPLAWAAPYGHLTPELVKIGRSAGFADAFGTHLSPAGKLEGCYFRHLANASGYVDYSGEEAVWPWEE